MKKIPGCFILIVSARVKMSVVLLIVTSRLLYSMRIEASLIGQILSYNLVSIVRNVDFIGRDIYT